MTFPAAPYPPDTRAKGWRFELDYEQIEQSDTWDLAGPEGRPWLLMMWLTAWRQVPCGSMPADEEVIAAKLGMAPKVWAKHRKALMRGWSEADDGRLYHSTMTARVLEMMKRRRSDSDRKAQERMRKAAESHADPTGVTPESRVTSDGVTPESSTDHRIPTKEIPSNLTVAPHRPSADGPQLSLVEPQSQPKGPPDCPHQAILDLWAELLPAMPQHQAGQWKGARAAHLRARWRVVAVAKGWKSADDGMAWMRRLFGYIGESAFLTGQVPSKNPSRGPFLVRLAWLVEPENWAKVVEGEYHRSAA